MLSAPVDVDPPCQCSPGPAAFRPCTATGVATYRLSFDANWTNPAPRYQRRKNEYTLACWHFVVALGALRSVHISSGENQYWPMWMCNVWNIHASAHKYMYSTLFIRGIKRYDSNANGMYPLARLHGLLIFIFKPSLDFNTTYYLSMCDCPINNKFFTIGLLLSLFVISYKSRNPGKVGDLIVQ